MGEITKNVEYFLSILPRGAVLCAASKTRSALEIEEAIKAGSHVIGMNYLQETLLVKPLVKKEALWSFIGRLQSNKIRKIVAHFERIETVSSLKEAELINESAKSCSKTMEAMIEVNIGNEKNKNGASLNEVEDLLILMKGMDSLNAIGLMTMGSLGLGAKEMEREFSLMKSFYDNLKETIMKDSDNFRYLSMGMSDSYELAIDCGSNYIRIGTGIYGPRK